MAASGDVLRFVDGSEFRITKAAADTNGKYLEMEWWLPPSTETPPKHIHPHQREDYEVLEGAFEDYFAAESALMEAGRIRSYSSPPESSSASSPTRRSCAYAGLDV